MSKILFTGGGGEILGDTVNKRAVCILLECNLVGNDFKETIEGTHLVTSSFERFPRYGKEIHMTTVTHW